MKLTVLYSTVIRLFGIFILLEIAFQSIFSISYLNFFDNVAHSVGALISLAAFVFLFNLVFFKTDLMLKWLRLDKEEGELVLQGVQIEDLVKFALVIVFVGFVLNGLQNLIAQLPWYMLASDANIEEGFYERFAFNYLVQFLLGLGGLFNLNGLTNFIVRRNKT